MCSNSVKDDRDRLSELPDDVIVRILSCMPTIDAVRTVLLRRFGNFWTFIHTIDFYDFLYPEELRTWVNDQLIPWFCRFVRNVMMLHQSPVIDKFLLCIEFDVAPDDIREWLVFALGKKAKEIRLFDDGFDDCSFSLSSMFSKLESQFLVTLDLDYCTFKEEVQIKFESLRKLSLCHYRMTNESFQSFISGCPSLQELVIVNPRVAKLSFSAPNISKLSLSLNGDCDDYYYEKHSLSFNFPNLKSLYLESQLCQLDTIDISSVSDVYVNYPQVEDPSPHLPPQMLYTYGKGNSWKSQLRLTELLLKSAKVLDKLVIVPIEGRLKEADQLEFVELVSRFPRASPTARIIFA